MKKILNVIICAILVFSVTGCSYSGIFNKDKRGTNTGVSDNKDKNNKVNKKDTKGIDVTIGQNIQYDDHYNISFEDSLFSEKIEPTNPDNYYTYYPAGNGNTYLVVKTVIKNLGTDTLSGSKLPKAKLIYNNKYNYEANLMTEEDDGSRVEQYDWYMDIEPLKTKKIWYAIEVPKEVENNTETTLILQYQINGKTYNVKVR